jgi:hypothetical protein
VTDLAFPLAAEDRRLPLDVEPADHEPAVEGAGEVFAAELRLLEACRGEAFRTEGAIAIRPRTADAARVVLRASAKSAHARTERCGVV